MSQGKRWAGPPKNNRKWTSHPGYGDKYILRNVHPKKMDVSLGDLGYHIPYGQSRDLRSPTAHLNPEAIERSRLNGSIAERLRQGVLIEVQAVVLTPPPQISIAEPAAISFPQRTKSLIVPENGDLTESIQSTIADEDAELIKQMEEDERLLSEGEAAGLPITVDEVKATKILEKISVPCCGGKGRK